MSSRSVWSVSKLRRVVATSAAAVLVGTALAGCTLERSDAAAEAEKEIVKDTPATISVKDGATEVEPGIPVKVNTPAGLSSVTMTNESGKEVKASFNDDRTEWTTAEPLGYGKTYTVKAMTKQGTATLASFTTVTPSLQMSGSVSPLEGSEVGVAQAVVFYFDVSPQDRQAVQDAITIETSNNTVGGFYWIEANKLIWRPKEYWEPGTKVTVKADLYGKDFGNGIYGQQDTETNFTIGEEVRTVVDNSTKTLTVYRNGEKIKSFNIALGRDGSYDTPNGNYVVGDRHDSLVMDSRTYGLSLEAGGYVTPVNYATQLSWSGIYVHSAPWATWALGQTNVSHGCINATPADAKWYMDTVKRGDPVEIVNTKGSTLPGTDGLGYWNIDWETIKAGNADTSS
ncbi:Ig-like domain-containing protein [Corynebacterium sp. MSK044]|uniref:L,D-transpeptidase n=1 Tax=Corynebacterium sp. MSK044 TaxID=3050195 RepID=UPI00254C210D|nr:Ig-like domain-containing protein [Corynebacterium sp. MSK044]MDK8798323.1 Ig-like domain-containing protein [Corynebacterium sp. MSK044]